MHQPVLHHLINAWPCYHSIYQHELGTSSCRHTNLEFNNYLNIEEALACCNRDDTNRKYIWYNPLPVTERHVFVDMSKLSSSGGGGGIVCTESIFLEPRPQRETN